MPGWMSQVVVRKYLANSLHEMARLLGTGITERALLEPFQRFLKDEDEVLASIGCCASLSCWTVFGAGAWAGAGARLQCMAGDGSLRYQFGDRTCACSPSERPGQATAAVCPNDPHTVLHPPALPLNRLSNHQY